MLQINDQVKLLSPPTSHPYRVIRVFNQDEYIDTNEGSFLYAKKGNVTIQNEMTGDTIVTCEEFVEKVVKSPFAIKN
ncbi:hypothetical protein [Persicobacter diffluens]|uniref:Uncharacterized protein n=1 Tax=Persicobacter diffluens TaxID=981 RepID=A0AAN4W2D3_9BACT|nr:hypothetical protein PEDI_32420 [Persicobacter diffluens]